MAALANRKIGTKSNMKEIIVLYLLGTFLAAFVAVIAGFAFPTEVVLAAKRRFKFCTTSRWSSVANINFKCGR